MDLKTGIKWKGIGVQTPHRFGGEANVQDLRAEHLGNRN